MSETTESLELPEGVQELLAGTSENQPTFHPVLRVWREVLAPAKAESTKRVTPAFANKITSSYRELDFADMNDYRDRYFAKIAELAHILDLEIATDSDCLSYTTPEEDVENNSTHYKNLLLDWQKAILQWELDWDCTARGAAAELAAISETHRMFFGDIGLVAYLDNIKLEFDEGDQEAMSEALNEMREGQ